MQFPFEILPVGKLVEWLVPPSARKASRKVRDRVAGWLPAVLAPRDHDSPEILARKLAAVARCRDVVRKKFWTVLYDFRIRVRLGQWGEALQTAGTIPIRKCELDDAREVVALVARCHVELEQWHEAAEHTGRLLKARRGLPCPELKYWLGIAAARETSESGRRLSSDSLRQLLAPTADRE